MHRPARPRAVRDRVAARPRRAGHAHGHGAARARPDAADARGAPSDRRRHRRRHPRLRPARAVPSGRHRDGDHGQRPREGVRRADRQDRADGRDIRRRRARVAHHRQDRLADRPSRRRVVADGRRAPPGREPCERDHPTARPPRSDAHDPKVLARPVHDGRSHRVRLHHKPRGALPGRVREGEAQHPHLRRYRHR